MRRSILHQGGTTQPLSPGDWLPTIEAGSYAAIVFDCDGTLVQSATAHLCAMQFAASDQGHDMSEAWYQARTGLDRQSLFAQFRTHVGQAFDVARASEVSIAAFGTFSHLVQPIPEVRDLVQAVHAMGLPLAVATNAERCVAENSLARVGLRDAFQQIISISDGHDPKPSPQMFLAAMKGLGVAPERTLIFEDSTQGVEAGQRAGADVVQILEHADR